jgi:hypothetical protein
MGLCAKSGSWVTMGKLRTVLACLIALAVAMAPVAATAIAGARPASASLLPGCHGAGPTRHHAAACTDGAATMRHCHHSASQDMDKGSCPDCPDQDQTKKCMGDGSKCCKLTGMMIHLPAVTVAAGTVQLEADPPALTGWRLRPSPPPPRA